jgi:hypothetical protein
MTASDVSSLEFKTKKEGINLFKNRPMNFYDCINYAVHKFYKLFRNDIISLLKVYPTDHKTKEGNLFWTLPKRPPVPQELNVENPFHLSFVISAAALRAAVFGINCPDVKTPLNRQ